MFLRQSTLFFIKIVNTLLWKYCQNESVFQGFEQQQKNSKLINKGFKCSYKKNYIDLTLKSLGFKVVKRMSPVHSIPFFSLKKLLWAWFSYMEVFESIGSVFTIIKDKQHYFLKIKQKLFGKIIPPSVFFFVFALMME